MTRLNHTFLFTKINKLAKVVLWVCEVSLCLISSTGPGKVLLLHLAQLLPARQETPDDRRKEEKSVLGGILIR